MKRIKRMSLGLHFHDKPLKKFLNLIRQTGTPTFIFCLILFSSALHTIYITLLPNLDAF